MPARSRSRFVVLLVAAAMVTAAPVLARAQTTAGVKVGVGMARLAIEPEGEASTSGTAGIVAGVFAGRAIGDALGVLVEVLWVRNGASLYVFGSSVDVDLTYLEIPVLVRYQLGASDSARPYLAAGPALGVRLSDTQVLDGETLEGSAKVAFGRGDVGLAIGAGVEGPRWLFDGRYTHGFVNFHADDPELTALTGFRNRTFIVSVGWKLR
jgi:hypothetical protein